MNIKMRGMVVRGAALMILSLALIVPSFAQVPTKSLKDQLVGHWRLVSVSINNSTPYGTDPKGSMFFDAGGHYSVIVATAGRARSIAYFGTYTANDADNSVTMHIDAGSIANAAGRDQKRFVTFTGDQLTVANQASAGPLGGVKLTWQQAN